MKTYNIPLAKVMRKNMTPWERKLWYEYLRYYPVRFQRQKAIGNYIVDFYCAKARLVVELDGSGHYNSKQFAKDKVRTRELEKLNLKVLRFSNFDVTRNLRGVCERIDLVVKMSLPQSRPHKLHIVRFAANSKAYSLRCSSLSQSQPLCWVAIGNPFFSQTAPSSLAPAGAVHASNRRKAAALSES